MTFEELQKVNEQIKTKPIKGKEYAEVPERVQAFRKLFPDGNIVTEIVQPLTDLSQGVVTFKASVYDADGNHLGDGTAQEKEGSSFINKTSYIENAETSAIGRALGFVGIGSGSSIASAEEVENAMANQNRQAQPPKVYQRSEPPQVKPHVQNKPAEPPKSTGEFRLWKEKITPLWQEVKGNDHASAVDLGRRYKKMNSDEEYQALFKELMKEKRKREKNK